MGIVNADEEQQREFGPQCDQDSCRFPYGRVQVGNATSPIDVDVFVFFDKTGLITNITIGFDKTYWDDVLELLNRKYGDDWIVQTTDSVTMDYESKQHEPDILTNLTHRHSGRNVKTYDACSIRVSSRDVYYRHTTDPIYRAVMEINLISRNI